MSNHNVNDSEGFYNLFGSAMVELGLLPLRLVGYFFKWLAKLFE